ncbi:MAG: hypothetical protein GF388_11260 [Candidatus Aegiribacteria sp.]|nr:hypothetical protein [Candidatus Aegiribacteria sp.]MBD3295574.1 hypothetical protein [Candidatus Fermentibacteria bacterium]
MYDLIGIWVAAFFTLAIYSFLYKENPLYRLAEHLVVGISLGYGMAITYTNVIKPRLLDPLFTGNHWILVIPAILGILYITRFIPNLAWLSRYPIAFIMGSAMGVGFPLTMKANVLRQLEGAMIPLYQQGMPWDVVIGNIVMIFGTLAALIYFFFSKPHKGPFFGTGSKIGIWVIMLGFGATFGFTVMGRISLLIGRVQFLLEDWLHLIK